MVRELSPQKREKYLSTALRLFASQGVENTSTAEIAREAGTAAGTLFLYFPTKQDLVHALVLKISSEQSAFIRARLDPAMDARNTFRAIWEGSLRWFLEHPEATRYVQQVRDSGQVAEAVVQESNQHLSYYYEAIQKGLTESAIQPYPLELVGSFLYHGLVGVMELLKAQPQAAGQATLIQQGFEIFWNGVRK